MNISLMSNADLLSALVGPTGRALAKRSLVELFGLTAPRQEQMVMCEEVAAYVVHPQIAAAKELLMRAMHEQLQEGREFCQPEMVKHFLRGKIGHLEYEVFWVMYFDIRNRLILAEEAFRGTVSQTSVYPREIVKRALAINASAVVFSHNHPSGLTTPSRADETLTNTLKTALSLVDVRVLDHIIVSGHDTLSMAEKGLI